MMETDYPLNHASLCDDAEASRHSVRQRRQPQSEGQAPEQDLPRAPGMMAYGLLLLKRLADMLKPSEVIFAACGVREGCFTRISTRGAGSRSLIRL